MKIVVEGCCHGELDKIYDVIGQLKEREGLTVDLLICCGDFQAVRDETDLLCMAVPPKYREMGSFHQYYNGEKTAPVLTIFIGGNHEASNHLWELSYGGWVAPNIYYLGTAGVVQFGGVRIAGLSGIYKEGDYRKGRFERPPFSESTKRSVYHVRSCDVFRLKQLSGRVDIGLSHDWPQGIYHHGNKAQLLRKKSYFADEISETTLGSPAAMSLLQHLQPHYWFSAHLHVKFAAVYHHHDDSVTKFLALDKCLPGRRFMQVLDLPAPCSPPYQLSYDAEWLAILRNTETLMGYSQSLWLPPHPSTDTRVSFTPEEGELKEVEQLFQGDLTIPHNFVPTTTSHTSTPSHYHSPHTQQENTQTAAFCQTLGIVNHFTPKFNSHNASQRYHGNSPLAHSNPDEIALSSDEDADTASAPLPSTTTFEKRHYPWLDDSSGDEQEQHRDTGQTSLSSDGAGQHEVETSFSEVQKSLHSEFSEVNRQSAGSCDQSVRSCDQSGGSCDQSGGPCDQSAGSCDLGVGSCDQSAGSCDQGGIQQSGPDAVPDPDSNPDEIVLDDEIEEDVSEVA